LRSNPTKGSPGRGAALFVLAGDCVVAIGWLAEVTAGVELPCEQPHVAMAPASTRFRPAFSIVHGILSSAE
jgi:hypothetical protein